MALHIILGGPTRKGPFVPVYIGPSGSESEDAIRASTHAVHCIQHNPQVWFKNNPNAVNAVAAPIAEVVEAVAPTADLPKRGRK